VDVSPEELGYLASYFGVYLELSNENNATQRVALICGSGRVTAKLLVVQLQKILDSSAQLDTYSDSEVTPELLNTYDIVLSTVEIPFECNRPILYIHEIFDEADLRKRLQKVRYWHQSDMEMVDDNWYVMADVLEEDTFFILDEYDNYQEALNAMMDQLTEKGYLDNEFAQRIWQREEKGSMIFEHAIAIPHTIQMATDSFVLAIGISKKPLEYKGRNAQIIFLMGLPDTVEENGDLLIRLYDEIMTIVKDEELIANITKSSSFAQLLRVLYKRF
jgi:lichenan operon transcriptional antiterminator